MFFFYIGSKILNVKSQRQVFEELAKSKGLNPLEAETWYRIPQDSISRLKVQSFSTF